MREWEPLRDSCYEPFFGLKLGAMGISQVDFDALAIKAKLEAVEAGISSFEEEFLAHVVLPDGSTFGAWAKPQLAAVYAGGSMPALLPGAG